MGPYIFTSRNGIHVIDLQQTVKLINVAYRVVRDTVARGGSVLFVGTKKQAQEAIQEEAENCGQYYVNHRWLGGTLTNYATLLKSVHKLKEYEKMDADGTFDLLSKKEASRKRKNLVRLRHYLDGIKAMSRMPSLIFVVDTNKEHLAIKEANKLGIPIIGIVDTNADPTVVQYPIPANDDAIRAIKLLCSVMARAVQEGQQARDDEKTAAESIEEQFLQAEKNAEKVKTEAELLIEQALLEKELAS